MYYLLFEKKKKVINEWHFNANKQTKLIIYKHSKILYSRVKIYFQKKIPILAFLKYI